MPLCRRLKAARSVNGWMNTENGSTNTDGNGSQGRGTEGGSPWPAWTRHGQLRSNEEEVTSSHCLPARAPGTAGCALPAAPGTGHTCEPAEFKVKCWWMNARSWSSPSGGAGHERCWRGDRNTVGSDWVRHQRDASRQTQERRYRGWEAARAQFS